MNDQQNTQQPVQGGGDAPQVTREELAQRMANAGCGPDETLWRYLGESERETWLKAADVALPPAQPAPEFDVRTILLDVVPGDGDGYEVYAKTTADVVAKLTEMGERLEAFELAQPAPQAQGVDLPYGDGVRRGVPDPQTPAWAAYFIRRFKHEEKLLGPNEQAALDYVLALLAATPPSPVAQPEAPRDPVTITSPAGDMWNVDPKWAPALQAALGHPPQSARGDDIRDLSKWLNEESTAPIDRQALARVLARASLPASGVRLHVECRECSDCGHTGINDDCGINAACNTCGWSGPSPKEDKCPECHRTGTMISACPKCSSSYSLVAEADLATPQPAAARVGLSAEQIAQLWAFGWTGDRVKFVRAIEAAHGIASPQEDGGTA